MNETIRLISFFFIFLVLFIFKTPFPVSGTRLARFALSTYYYSYDPLSINYSLSLLVSTVTYHSTSSLTFFSHSFEIATWFTVLKCGETIFLFEEHA